MLSLALVRVIGIKPTLLFLAFWIFRNLAQPPQNRKRDTDVQNRLLDSVGEGKGGMLRENSMYIIYSETDHHPRWDA